MIGDSRACWKLLGKKAIEIYGNIYCQECAENIYGKKHPNAKKYDKSFIGMKCGQVIN